MNKSEIFDNLLKENGYKEIKVYNAFNAVSDSNPNMKKENFTKKSLVDPLEKVPTLKEYVNRYVATGDLSVLPFSKREIDELDENEDDEDFSSPLYDKDADIEDLKDYNEEIKTIIQEDKKKKVLKNKLSKDTTEKKESDSQTNVVSENNHKEIIE